MTFAAGGRGDVKGSYGRGKNLVEGEWTLILEDLGGAVEGAGVL